VSKHARAPAEIKSRSGFPCAAVSALEPPNDRQSNEVDYVAASSAGAAAARAGGGVHGATLYPYAGCRDLVAPRWLGPKGRAEARRPI